MKDGMEKLLELLSQNPEDPVLRMLGIRGAELPRPEEIKRSLQNPLIKRVLERLRSKGVEPLASIAEAFLEMAEK